MPQLARIIENANTHNHNTNNGINGDTNTLASTADIEGADAAANDKSLDKAIEKDATASLHAASAAGAITQVSNGSSKETQKKGKQGKKGGTTKEDGGHTKRKGKGAGDLDSQSTKSKRQKRPS